MGHHLDFLVPDDCEVLIDAKARVRLAAAAMTMPAIPRVAVEIRLAAGQSQVDLQQCFLRSAGDFPRLAAYCQAKAAERPDWVPVAHYCRDLADPGQAFGESVTELYLEHDLLETGETPSAPALFVDLPGDPASARALALETARRLQGAALPGTGTAIGRIFDACRGDAFVSHIGCMTGRTVPGVRINVKGIRPAALEPFLKECGWPGDSRRGSALFDFAVGGCDRVTLAFDIVGALLPNFGVECFFDHQPAEDPAWRRMLRLLTADGLCAADKGDAFQTIPATITPAGWTGAWPTDMAVGAMLGSDREFTSYARRAVHLKIVDGMGGSRSAKAYYGAGYLTIAPLTDPEHRRWRPTLAAPAPRRSVRADHVALADPADRAIAHGVEYLLQTQRQSGLWREFPVPSGISDNWVSGFIGTQLVATGDPRGRAAAEEALDRLLTRQRPDSGWAYNEDHPTDSDSTAWILRLMRSLGRLEEPAARRAIAFVRAHVQPSGGIVSFRERQPVADVAKLPDESSLAGWMAVHDCVTAGAAPFGGPAVADYLLANEADGAWRAYWWVHDAFASALAVEALLASDHAAKPEWRARVQRRATGWIEEALASERCEYFDLAFAVRALIGTDPEAAKDALVAAAAARMLADQAEDGSWRPSARMRVPWHAAMPDSMTVETVAYDRQAGFTTAAVIATLAMLRDGRMP
ncbi:prenyltransferase/squalene oxidase repeat-containing protein [Sphingomonas caeni]|uniref:prenyltransferase/squalene oxidase repeat-containing protein n=1 Tax=Sphingomonas caeni TaxID=2984949 RepID=UPI00222FE345|nr:prenyltransferase/squalene oxidase repeat-containing protein [Sphingomonas caeni]